MTTRGPLIRIATTAGAVCLLAGGCSSGGGILGTDNADHSTAAPTTPAPTGASTPTRIRRTPALQSLFPPARPASRRAGSPPPARSRRRMPPPSARAPSPR